MTLTKHGVRPARKVWAGLERYDLRRNQEYGYREELLPEDTGTVHALGWRTGRNTREPEFFAGAGPYALCGTHVKVRLPVPFDADDPEACKRCADKVAAGETVHHFYRVALPCRADVRPDLDGFPQMVVCLLPDGHSGPHKCEGGTWRKGPEDFTPSGDYRL